jgi:hypothetical protein
MTTLANTPGDRAARRVMWVGAGLTLVAAALPFLDQAVTVLADHVRAGYPTYGPGEIDTAVRAYQAILAVVGVLGLVGWVGTAWAVRAGKSWARVLASGAFVAAVCIALAGLTVKDTSGDVGLAPQLGWLQLLPCIPGLAAVVLLWRKAR